MVTTVMGYLRVFKDAGPFHGERSSGKGITHAQVSNLFWINVAVSGAISLIFAAGSPQLFVVLPGAAASFPLPWWLSITFAFKRFDNPAHGLIKPGRCAFKAVAFIQVGSLLTWRCRRYCNGLANYSYWALVFSNLVTVAAAVP